MSKTIRRVFPLFLIALAVGVSGQDESINDLYFRNTTLGDLAFDFPYPDSVLFDRLQKHLNSPGRPFNDRVFAVYRDFIRLKAVRSGVAAVFPDLESLVERSRFSEKSMRFAAEFLLSYKESRKAVDMFLKLIEKIPQRISEYEAVIDIMRKYAFPPDELKKIIADFCDRTSGQLDLRIQALNLFFVHRFKASGWQYLRDTVEKNPTRLSIIFSGTVETLKTHASLSEITDFWIPRLDPYTHTGELLELFRFLEKSHTLDRFIEDQKGTASAKAFSVLALHMNGQNEKVEALISEMVKEGDVKKWALLLKNLGPEFGRFSLSLFLAALNSKLEAETVTSIVDLLVAGNVPASRIDVSNLKVLFGFDANISLWNGLFAGGEFDRSRRFGPGRRRAL